MPQGYEQMEMTVYSNKTVSLDGLFVGRIDQDSFQMLTHIRGNTTFYTGEPNNMNVPHQIDAPLYISAKAGSVTDWVINPEFIAAVKAIIA